MRHWAAALILVILIVPGLAFGDVYYWTDKDGVQYYTTNLENIPEVYRPTAQLLSLSEAPPAPPDLPVTPPQKGSTRIPFVPGSPVLVPAKINGAGPITLILDTGADRTLISPSVLASLGVSTEGAYRGILKGVTGAGYTDAVWIASLEVGEAKAGPLLVIAHDAGLKGADGLLGRDFLANFNVTIDPKERVVTFAPN
jgi:Aspartyl protease